MSESIHSELYNRLIFLLMQRGIDVSGLKEQITVLFDDYNIEPKETALTVYTGGKNEYYLQQFLLAKAVAGRTQNTIKHYKTSIELILHEIGKDFDTITTQDVQVYLAKKMSKGNSRCYCDNIRRDMNSFYNWLELMGYIQKNPMRNVEIVKFYRQKEEAFTEVELERMRNACKTTFERAIIEMLLSTGCRASELVSIKLGDFKGDTITVLGKGNKFRKVFVNARAQIAVEEYMKERKDHNPFLFPMTKGGGVGRVKALSRIRSDWFKYPEYVSETGHYGKDSVNGLIHHIADRAGVEGAHTHRFRRTCATMALRRGMPIEQVSMMLGHEQINTTQIYLDIREEDLHNSHMKYVT